jgi:hypothetical protein
MCVQWRGVALGRDRTIVEHHRALGTGARDLDCDRSAA